MSAKNNVRFFLGKKSRGRYWLAQAEISSYPWTSHCDLDPVDPDVDPDSGHVWITCPTQELRWRKVLIWTTCFQKSRGVGRTVALAGWRRPWGSCFRVGRLEAELMRHDGLEDILAGRGRRRTQQTLLTKSGWGFAVRLEGCLGAGNGGEGQVQIDFSFLACMTR